MNLSTSIFYTLNTWEIRGEIRVKLLLTNNRRCKFVVLIAIKKINYSKLNTINC